MLRLALLTLGFAAAAAITAAAYIYYDQFVFLWLFAKGKILGTLIVGKLYWFLFRFLPKKAAKALLWVFLGPRVRNEVRSRQRQAHALLRVHKKLMVALSAIIGALLMLTVVLVSVFYTGSLLFFAYIPGSWLRRLYRYVAGWVWAYGGSWIVNWFDRNLPQARLWRRAALRWLLTVRAKIVGAVTPHLGRRP